MNAPAARCRDTATTADTADCFYAASKKADAELNRTYSEIGAALKNRGRKDDIENLVDAQRLWLQFRDASCKAERALYQGGTAAPVAYSACIEELTRKRTEDLKATYEWVVIKFGNQSQNGGK
jgi:uncharacterized protein YecT (DUF1311 family)